MNLNFQAASPTAMSYLRDDTIRVDRQEYDRLVEQAARADRADAKARAFQQRQPHLENELESATKNLRFLRRAKVDAAKAALARAEEIGDLKDLLKQSVYRHHRLEPGETAHEAYNLGIAPNLRITIKDTVSSFGTSTVRKQITVQRVGEEAKEDTRTPAQKAADELARRLPISMPSFMAKKASEILAQAGMLKEA